jgi:hypothetical protein
MNSQQRPAGHEAVTPEDVADALSVLRAASRWELTPTRWTEVRRAATEVMNALAADDGPGLRSMISAIELLGPVRQATRSLALPASGEVLNELTALVDVLTELESMGEPRQPWAGTLAISVSIYLGDGTSHEQVESAIEELARSAGLIITDREDPVAGSWFRRMRAKLAGAAQSPAGQEALADVAYRAELELVLRPEAEVTALLMANLASLIASLHDTKDAVIRIGAVLVVKYDWTLYVYRLTTRQQLILNHSPHLLVAPDKILQALGLPQSEAAVIPADPS